MDYQYSLPKACDLGYAAELWTLAALHKHIQAHAEEAGYPRLKTVTKPWLQKYLKKMDIKPFKIKYYLERKDPDFENKMHDVLLVYKQVEMQFGDDGTITIPEMGIWHILFPMMKNPAFRLLPTNIPIIIRQRKRGISAGIMSMCGLERCLCLQELIFWRGMQFRWSARHTKFWFYRVSKDSRCKIPKKWHNTVDTGQSFSAYIKGNTPVSCRVTGRQICVCIYTDTHLMAEHDRKLLQQDDKTDVKGHSC